MLPLIVIFASYVQEFVVDNMNNILPQGSYWSWKTWKVMEFDNLDSRPGKSWNVGPGHGKSWNLMLANMHAVYCSGLSEMYAGKHLKLWQDVNLL